VAIFTKRLFQIVQRFLKLIYHTFITFDHKAFRLSNIYVILKIFIHKDKNLTSIWCISRSSMVISTNTIQIDSIHVIKEKVSLKLIPSTYVNLLATKQTLCLATNP